MTLVVLRAPIASLLFLTACVTPGEKLADEAASRGNTAEAVRAYDAALAEKPIMDFEWERIRDKRQRLVEGTWGPKLDALAGPGDERRNALEHCDRLLTFRKEARDANTTRAVAVRTDEVIARECTGPRLEASLPAGDAAALEALLTLFDRAKLVAAPQGVLDALAEPLAHVLARPVSAPAAGTGQAFLEATLQLRERLRRAGLAASLDAKLDARLALLGPGAFPLATPENAAARFTRLLELRNEARRLGAPPRALQTIDAAHDQALQLVVAAARAKADAHRFLEAVLMLEPFIPRTDAQHPLRKVLLDLLAEGAAFHTQQAEKLPHGFRRYLEASLAATLSAGTLRGAAQTERKTLKPEWETSLALTPAPTVDASCASVAQQAIAAATTTGARAMALELRLVRCVRAEGERSAWQTISYLTEETYVVREKKLVGRRAVQVQSGSHQEQCSQGSSLPGYTWQGVCTVPDYKTVYEDIYEDVDVQKVRDVTRSLNYEVRTRWNTARVEGVASVTWEDGTRLELPFSGEGGASVDGWSYEVPGRRLADRPTRVEQRIPADFSLRPTELNASSTAGGRAVEVVFAAVRKLRARLARDEGARALAAGNEVGAGEAFVRSVLHDHTLEGDAARWLVGAHGAPAELLRGVLSESGVDKRVPQGATALATAEPYRQERAVATTDAFDRRAAQLEKDVSVPTAETYKAGIRMPNEIVGFHGGLSPWDVQLPGARFGQRVSANVAFELQYHFLEMLGLTYGLVVHDAATARFTIGLLTAPQRQYTNGKDEGGFSMSVDASYALHAGLRVHYGGVFVGLQAGYQHNASGQTWAYGFHVEPSVRLALRLFRTEQLIIEATGWLPFIPGVARKDRVTLSIPLAGFDLKLMIERAGFNGSQLADDGVTRESLGTVTYQTAAVQLGFRL